MARDGHYNSDSPVFYKNYYELSRREKRTVFSSRYYAHDVLDTIYSVRRHHVHMIDTPNNVLIAICHVPRSLTICPTPPSAIAP